MFKWFGIIIKFIKMFHVELLSGLWISDTDILCNKKFMEDNQIGIILNCTQYFDFPSCDVQKIRLPFSPSQSDEANVHLLKQNQTKIVDFILENLISQNILISCYDGKCISPLIVALVISKGSHINKQSIYEILLSHHKDFVLWCDLRSFD